jgi:hypothetical protein
MQPFLPEFLTDGTAPPTVYAVTRLDQMTVPFLVNLVGFGLNTSFVACYWMYATGKSKRDIKVQFGVLAVVTVFSAFLWMATGSNDSIGYVYAMESYCR